MIDLGRVRPGATLHIPFGSYAATTGASSATTNYAAADVQIYKDGGLTQRASSAGITATTDYDSLTGINMVTIDLSDNTTAGFYSAGSEFVVVIADVTIDAQTVRFPIARFTLGFYGEIHSTSIASLSSQTSFTLTTASANNSAYVGCVAYVQAVASAVQGCFGIVSAYTGSTKTVTLLTDPAIFTMASGDNCYLFPPSGNVLGSVAGSVASVTGAVGSVTGSVASVTGAVGSVTSGVNATQLAGQTITAAAGVTFPTSVASPTNITAGTITTVTNLTNAPTAGDLTSTMKTSVNAEVVDALATDTYTEPVQGTPLATTSLAAKINYLYKFLRNKKTQTSAVFSVFNDDAATVDHKATVSDDGTTTTVGEIATGP